MKVCAPFVYNIAMGLASQVPEVYVERMKQGEESFYGPLRRRCRQHVRKLAKLDVGDKPSLFSKTVLSRYVGSSRNGKVIRRNVGRPPMKIARSKSMSDLQAEFNKTALLGTA
jgi:hypothetical protein